MFLCPDSQKLAGLSYNLISLHRFILLKAPKYIKYTVEQSCLQSLFFIFFHLHLQEVATLGPYDKHLEEKELKLGNLIDTKRSKNSTYANLWILKSYLCCQAYMSNFCMEIKKTPNFYDSLFKWKIVSSKMNQSW